MVDAHVNPGIDVADNALGGGATDFLDYFDYGPGAEMHPGISLSALAKRSWIPSYMAAFDHFFLLKTFSIRPFQGQ